MSGLATIREQRREAREHGDGILILTNSSNGESIFKPLVEALLGQASFPFEWEGYTPYDKLSPPPGVKEHKQVTLTVGQLSRLAGKYALTADLVLTVTVEDGRLFIRENEAENGCISPKACTISTRQPRPTSAGARAAFRQRAESRTKAGAVGDRHCSIHASSSNHSSRSEREQ